MLTAIAYTNMFNEAMSITFPVALAKSAPCARVSKYIVDSIIAGNVEKIPPQFGPASAVIVTAPATTVPANIARISSSPAE